MYVYLLSSLPIFRRGTSQRTSPISVSGLINADYCPGRANWICSKSFPRLRLDPRAGGNSFRLAICCATRSCAGAIRNMRASYQLFLVEQKIDVPGQGHASLLQCHPYC